MNTGQSRNGEPSWFKYTRLLPVVLAIVAVVGGWFTVMAGQGTNTKAIADGVNDRKEIRSQVQVLKEQAVRVDERTKNMEKLLDEQKTDIKLILIEIQRNRIPR